MTAPASDHERAVVVALSGLPRIGPGRLRALLGRRAPSAVWAEMIAGRLEVDADLAAACAGERDGIGKLLHRWTDAARAVDVDATWGRHREAGIAVLLPGDPHWPLAIVDDPDPPAVLLALGDVGLLGDVGTLGGRPAAAVVGTRRCSRYGWDVARELGGDLAAAGVTVVSGLASGIDGAAHRGALDASGGAPPIGVVATGLDIVYPRAHRKLSDEVVRRGVLVSEWPLGTLPARWRFPARNRIIAALSGVTVVVESAASGGAMHTVDEAVRRDRAVLAVPGPVTSRASAGTNRLLADGAAPACDAADVLLALGLGGTTPAADVGADVAVPPPPTGDAARLLDALGWQPATLDQLVLRTGLPIGAAARLTAELASGGWLATDGGWFERRR